MKQEDVKIGMKVVPHKKSGQRERLNQSNNWKKAKEKNQPYLFVKRYIGGFTKCLGYEPEGTFTLSHSEEKQTGDFFHCSDFEPYQPKESAFYVVGFIDQDDGEFTLSGDIWQGTMTYDEAMELAKQRSRSSEYHYYVMKAIAKVEYIKPEPVPPIIITELE